MAVAISGNWGYPTRLNQFSSSSKVSRFDILPFYPPALYAWIEEHRLTYLRQFNNSKSWAEVVGGLWVEPGLTS